MNRLRDKRFNVPDIIESGDVSHIEEVLSIIDKQIDGSRYESESASGDRYDNIWLLKSKVMLLECLGKKDEAASCLDHARLGTIELMHKFYANDLPGELFCI